MKRSTLAASFFAVLTCATSARADVKLPTVFSDHMVLQSDAAVAVWGWADAGESVTVSLADQSKTTTTSADGKWMVKLDQLKPSSESRALTVKGRNTLTVNDVLVGEVWLASGQSNMEMQLKGKLHGSVDHADEEIAAANFPTIRMFVHDTPFAIYELPVPPTEPLADRPGKWRVCSPQTAADFSAIGYFFARDLHKQLGVPVGILSAAVGGTPIEAWTSLPAQQSEAKFKPLLDDWQKRAGNFDPEREQKGFLDKKKVWLKQRADASKKGVPAPKSPGAFKNLRVMTPGSLFNGVIAPLVPYTIRGVIWYQGERNAAGPFTELYGAQLRTLIADWRARWGKDFYFAWFQLPGFNKGQKLPSEPTGWGVAVRDEMRKTLSVPRTGMAITIDLGGEKAGHPTNKREFAARLSPLVLHDVYDKSIPSWSGPLFRSAQRDGEKMALTFDHAVGLKFSTGEPQGFAIAGSDKNFVWANAKVDGDKVIVWSDAVREPAAVRYAWAANPMGNLVNAAELPASPFRTDDWPLTTATTKKVAFEPLPLMEIVRIGNADISTKQLPTSLIARDVLGLVTSKLVNGQVVHRTTTRVLETRATITPGGDYLLMFPEGDHYAKSKGEKMNNMMAYRSSDHGLTWKGPTVAFDISYSQHGFIPFTPRGSKRLYAFGTQPIPGKWTWENGQRENASIGYRWSDDDGRTWSDVKLIAPLNAPEFRGMSVMRMTETDAGTWLLGSHLADWSVKPFTTRQYLLRSEDKGTTWTLLPGARPNGWFAEGFDRMDEGRPLNLGGGRVLFMSRTPQGHLFTAWSQDDGKTWTKPAPSSLVHPDAPPMLFPLSDGKTLVAFHHNKVPPASARELDDKAAVMKVRSEVWVSTSTDEGHTWSEPRFVMANAVKPLHAVGGFNFQCSYLDAFTENGTLHIFMPHRWQQVLHLTIKESWLAKLPTMSQLTSTAKPSKPAVAATKPKAELNYVAKLSAKIKPARQIVYKKIGDRELHLDVLEPKGLKAGDQRPCFVAIHGGGWTSGAPSSMYRFAEHCTELGIVGICVQYRLYKPGSEISVFDCVKDARSAVRYVRAHAAELGIDPHKIIVSGASAGGHLAAATAMFNFDEAGDDLSTPCAPNALMLFSPVIDTSTAGYGNAKVGERWEELSPAHRVRADMPPTILFHGTVDTTTPFKGAQLFHDAMVRAGNRCELVKAENAIHTYMFKDAALYSETLQRMDTFFGSLGYLSSNFKP